MGFLERTAPTLFLPLSSKIIWFSWVFILLAVGESLLIFLFFFEDVAFLIRRALSSSLLPFC